jgi:Asp-tRNA(Asn)/Glu-tRNA(Gln) amidotransferase C subunit
MKPINLPLLKDASTRLLFTMTDAQYDLLIIEFDILLKQMALIGEISGVDDTTPMSFPFTVTTSHMRKDEVGGTLTQVEALKNAASQIDGQIKLPKVVG